NRSPCFLHSAEPFQAGGSKDVMKGASWAAIRSRPGVQSERRPVAMVTAAIDVHKRILQAVVFDSESGELVEERFAGREALLDWAMRCRGRVEAVALEATTGWRWVARELQGLGVEV